MIPIEKPGKDSKNPSSYRPIRLKIEHRKNSGEIEKASDIIWYNCTILKFNKQVIPGFLVKIIQDFPSNRKFEVNVDGILPRNHNIPAGVSQGSTFSPTSFLFFQNDVPEDPRTRIKIFADDTAFTANSIKQDQASDYLQNRLDTMADYFRKWCLSLRN